MTWGPRTLKVLFLLSWAVLARPEFVWAEADSDDLAFSKDQINAVAGLAHEQDASGAIRESECLNKPMSKACRLGTSTFMTSMALDAIREVQSNPRLDSIRGKALAFLRGEQVAYGGFFKYYPSNNPKRVIVKFDVDDNALGLAALIKAGIPADPSALRKIKNDGLRDRVIFKRDGSEKFRGRIFSTWLNPSEPLFDDLDVVVNANALWLYGLAGEQADTSGDLKDVCAYVNQVVDWSAASGDWREFFNERKWVRLKKSDYSTWYPSPYVFAYNVVRAGTDGNQRCLAPSLAKIETLLTRSDRYEMTSYDQAFGTAALLRLAEWKARNGLTSDALLAHSASALRVLVADDSGNFAGKNRFFYYGATGYIGSRGLIESLKIEALSRYLRVKSFGGSPEIPLEISNELIRDRVDLGLNYFRSNQAPDGSWTHLIRVSSVMYACHVIYMYEYMNKADEKKDIISRMMNFIWTQQNAGGSYSGYPNGPDNPTISVMVYLAAKIAGENEDAPRMRMLEEFINRRGGMKAASFMAAPYLMLLGLDKRAGCAPSIGLGLALDAQNELPWARVMVYPFLYLIGSGKIHEMSDSKIPARIGNAPSGLCAGSVPHPLRRLHLGREKFFKWTLEHLNHDGTLFDYTPTTVPTLIALWTEGGKYSELVDQGIRTIESFQEPVGDGLFQSPGEASIGETYVIMNALMDLGFGSSEPMLRKSESFLYDVMQPGTGAFGFSKHNLYFADSDDTSNSIYVLKRMSLLRGDSSSDARLAKGLDWLLGVQNRDGGFGTWESEKIPFSDRLIGKFTGGKQGLVLSESVVEHTARIVLNLSLFKDRAGDQSGRIARSYKRAVDWIVGRQQGDGGYPGTWFVDYLFGTSMAMTALATAAGDPGVDNAIEEGLRFIMDHQREDGGFSESPESFIEKKSVSLAVSSPAQTGLIVSQLFMFLREEKYAHWNYLKPVVRRAVSFLLNTQGADGLWHDQAWSGVTFPGVEYLIYPYIQEIAPIQAMGMYRLAVEREQSAL